MRILFIHQNLPGQYRHLLIYYGARKDCEVVGLAEMKRLKENIRASIPGVKLVGYETPKPVSSNTMITLRTTEAAIQRGQLVLATLLRLKKAGFYPDVVYAHPGWGETLFLKDVFPETRLIHFCEFYYNANGQDFNFDPEFPNSAADLLRLRIRNFHHLMALEQADVGIAPTQWQHTRFPKSYQSKITVVHDGIDTKVCAPDPEAFVKFPKKNLILRSKDEVITFVSRNLEPYRGFHTFMRALPKIMKARPKAHIIIVGGDGVSYGRQPDKGTYKEKYLAEVTNQIDHSRVHFVGRLPYDIFLRVLQISSAHVYLTYPFVLSWSMMESMSIGCVLVGSNTPPVAEVIQHGKNGFLVDFFSVDEIVETITVACEKRNQMEHIRKEARNTILEKYDLATICLPKQREIIEMRSQLKPEEEISSGI